MGEVAASPVADEPQPLEEIAPVSSSVGVVGTGGWATRKLWVLEANIDDMTGEAAAYLTEQLLEVPGCLDAWLSPILMKKGRPAFTVHVLCDPEDQERAMRVLFTESTTLGVRRRSVERCALRRKSVSVSTTYGEVRVKVGEGVRSRVFLSMLTDTSKVCSGMDYMPAAVHRQVYFLVAVFFLFREPVRSNAVSSRHVWSYVRVEAFACASEPKLPRSCLRLSVSFTGAVLIDPHRWSHYWCLNTNVISSNVISSRGAPCLCFL